MGRKATGQWGKRTAYKNLTKDEVRFNRTAQKKKGKPGSSQFKRYVFGHRTNLRRGK